VLRLAPARFGTAGPGPRNQKASDPERRVPAQSAPICTRDRERTNDWAETSWPPLRPWKQRQRGRVNEAGPPRNRLTQRTTVVRHEESIASWIVAEIARKRFQWEPRGEPRGAKASAARESGPSYADLSGQQKDKRGRGIELAPSWSTSARATHSSDHPPSQPSGRLHLAGLCERSHHSTTPDFR
jgi:hypothetical protein